MNFISCNFGLKSYLWFQFKQVRHACWFWNHLLDFKLNCTPLSSITITVYRIYFTPCIFNDWYGIGNFIFVFKLTFLFSNSGCVFLFLQGFDPWNECSKGLADLLQEENKTTLPGHTLHTSTASQSQSFFPGFPPNVGCSRNTQFFPW